MQTRQELGIVSPESRQLRAEGITMKIISQPECQEWLERNLGSGFTALEKIYAYHVSYLLPTDTGVKTVLARAISRSIECEQPGLFWITDWGIFPSVENMALFDGYRKSLGEDRAIHAAPGHIFGESELQQLECLFDLALYFLWDANLFDGAGTIAVQISHDEFLSVHAKDEARLRQFQSCLERLKLKQGG
jgi:hypothetical protein